MNEPREICYQGYGDVTMAPALNIKGVAEYICAKNLLLAHAKAYHIYNQEFKPKYGGVIGITISSGWIEPESEEHAEAANEAILFELGIYAHPIFSTAGDFPPIMKQKISAKSAAQGFYRSRLPEFTKDEIEMVRGSSDFFGLNHYTTHIAYKNESLQFSDKPSFYDDLGVASYQLGEWPGSASSWLKSVPWGFYKLLTYIKDFYNDPNILVTENGFSTFGGLEDDERITYYRQYLDALLDAIEDGANVTAYTAWSLMDNFEWMQGYTERFGLYEVDYTSPQRTRTPRKSAFVYKEIVRTRSLDHYYEPDTDVMTIEDGH
ncbi:unnamed protein product [Diatraea saccharalis]|uniref:beta-glucosidase n=1 Tax=Diatraea saccharalis TaxID=40085 RepID=A0A9N9QVI8_9NEOP|nr:unnamed protein product [Diatraea saccharalis]